MSDWNNSQNQYGNNEYRPRSYGQGGGGGGGFSRFGGGGNDGARGQSYGGGQGGPRQFNRRPNYNGGGGGGGGGGFNRYDDNEEHEILKVPSRFVGRIIGRGGSKIGSLQAESGARIQVTKDVEGENTIIKLFGSENAISSARDLIGELTVDRDFSRN